MTAMQAPAKSTASGLARPISPARVDAKPKTPLPMTELMVSAVRLQRPMTRTSCGRDVLPWSVAVTARLYHKSASSSPGSYSAHRRLCAERRLDLVTLERMTDCTSGSAARSYRIMREPDFRDDDT